MADMSRFAAKGAAEMAAKAKGGSWNPRVAQRQRIRDAGCMCGLAYVANVPEATDGPASDDANIVQVLTNFQCFQYYDFLAALPDDHLIRTAGGDELYIVIPLDPDASVAVNAWDAAKDGVHDILYRSDDGAPLVVVCSHKGGVPDCQIVIADSKGQILDYKLTGEVKDDPAYLAEHEPQILDLTVRAAG